MWKGLRVPFLPLQHLLDNLTISDLRIDESSLLTFISYRRRFNSFTKAPNSPLPGSLAFFTDSWHFYYHHHRHPCHPKSRREISIDGKHLSRRRHCDAKQTISACHYSCDIVCRYSGTGAAFPPWPNQGHSELGVFVVAKEYWQRRVTGSAGDADNCGLMLSSSLSSRDRSSARPKRLCGLRLRQWRLSSVYLDAKKRSPPMHHRDNK